MTSARQYAAALMGLMFRSFICAALAIFALAPVSDEVHADTAPHADTALAGAGAVFGAVPAARDGANPDRHDPFGHSHRQGGPDGAEDSHQTGSADAFAASTDSHCHPGLDCFAQAIVTFPPDVTSADPKPGAAASRHRPLLTGTFPVSDPPPPRRRS